MKKHLGPRRQNSFSFQNLIYQPQYLKLKEREAILEYLQTLVPIWEQRYSNSNPPPVGEEQRQLLRPVYWLGNWQFACLDYYHPPKGIEHRCVTAEPYPDVLKSIVADIENRVRSEFSPRDVPQRWHLNTCLINFYGDFKGEDRARVGEHKDFEPGPVASLSIGEKALFQFVRSQSRTQKSQVVLQQWLEDSSLQIFGGLKFKKDLFHRVQRVERTKVELPRFATEDFDSRRVNFTFRYVPDEHIQVIRKFPTPLQADLKPYIELLARHSKFWQEQLASL
jgi:alkylated DNA repair dioxygenase AlkB